MIHIDSSDSLPIWKQIEDGVRYRIASGAFRPDDPVPSVRELARELRVNPLTVSKAYRRLVDRGVLAVRRGEGTFVAPNPPLLEASEMDRRLRQGALRYAILARTLGSSDDACIDVLGRVLEELDRNKNVRKEGT